MGEKIKKDHVPFLHEKGKLQILYFYFGSFNNRAYVQQIAKVIDEEHIKRCDARYEVLLAAGNSDTGFELIYAHSKSLQSDLTEKEELEELVESTEDKFRGMEKYAEKVLGKRQDISFSLRFHEGEDEDVMTKRIADNIKRFIPSAHVEVGKHGEKDND